ncbi:hypothetical protein Q9233_011344 [Columba guinea]|nr:hypothetical protein Q9233_011344 [Columba guinea]
MHRTMAWRAVLEMGSLHIHKAVRVARLPRGTHVPRALLGQGDQLGTRGGWGNLGASLSAQGSPGKPREHRCSPINNKTPGSCSRPRGWAALHGQLAAQHCGCPDTPRQSQAWRDVGFGEMESILPHPHALPVPWPAPCSLVQCQTVSGK